jgi:hypothetical protein
VTGREQSELLQRLVSRINTDEFADRVLDSYWSQLEPLGPRQARDQAHTWVRWNLELAMRWLIDAKPPGEAELEVLREWAGEVAREGLPVDLVPGNFRRAARFAWNAALELADEAERVALLEAADLVFAYVDRVSRIYTDAHAEAERAAPITSDERLARGLLARLTRDDPPTAEDVDLAGRFGFTLDGTFWPLVLARVDGSASQHLELAAQLRRENTLAVSEGRCVVVLSRARLSNPARALPRDATVAAGDLTARDQLGLVLAELRLLVQVAQGHGQVGMVEPSRYLPELLLRTGPRMAARIRHQVYGPLRAHPELSRTLDCLIEHNFNRQRAAAALPAHRNTLRDRVDRIAQLTGLDLDDAGDRGLAWLARLYASDPRGHG